MAAAARDHASKDAPWASRGLIEDAVGFAPTLASNPESWTKLGLFAWQGTCRRAQFSPLGEFMVVYHVGGASTVAASIGGRARWQTHPGLLTFVHPGIAIGWQIDGEVDSRSLHIASFLLEALTERSLSADLRIRFSCGVRDP